MTQGIIDVLRREHEEFRQTFAKLDDASGTRRRDLFQTLVGELVRHEVAEEIILRPVSRRDAGEAVANARMAEESGAESLLKQMEEIDPSGPEFTIKLVELRAMVEDHAAAEEGEEFPKVEQAESADRLVQMGQAYEGAKMMAPTRPHPETPNTPTANLLVGPFVAMMDRARDAMRAAVQAGQS